MNKFFLILVFLLFQTCSKPKTVLICGDHKCVNKSEAKQFFEENLSIEVKIISKDKNTNVDLVELNLNKNSDRKKINIVSKTKTNKKVKTLTENEIKKIKKELKKKEMKKRRIAKKNDFKGELKVSTPEKKFKNTKKINKINKEVIDVCTILDKCSIDEISKYLIKQGNNKKFPDITIRE